MQWMLVHSLALFQHPRCSQSLNNVLQIPSTHHTHTRTHTNAISNRSVHFKLQTLFYAGNFCPRRKIVPFFLVPIPVARQPLSEPSLRCFRATTSFFWFCRRSCEILMSYRMMPRCSLYYASLLGFASPPTIITTTTNSISITYLATCPARLS